MHKSSIIRMQWFIDNYASEMSKEKVQVLDVGSYDLNGSYRHLFDVSKYHYTGLDMEESPTLISSSRILTIGVQSNQIILI